MGLTISHCISITNRTVTTLYTYINGEKVEIKPKSYSIHDCKQHQGLWIYEHESDICNIMVLPSHTIQYTDKFKTDVVEVMETGYWLSTMWLHVTIIKRCK
jgi:hypothetical protein